MVKEVKLNTNKIRGLLVEKKISQDVIAKIFKVSRVTVCNMLHDRAKMSAEQLFLLANLTNEKMENFFI